MLYVVLVAMLLACSTLFGLLCLSVYMLNKLSKQIVDLEEQVEESLDLLDACYRDVVDVLATPVASDEPLIKLVVARIKDARDAILAVAGKISSFGTRGEDDEE